jgi:hypothetical protein
VSRKTPVFAVVSKHQGKGSDAPCGAPHPRVEYLTCGAPEAHAGPHVVGSAVTGTRDEWPDEGQARAELGEVRWHGAWRCFAFFPAAGTLFEPTCLRDLAAFIDWLMGERKAARA